MAAFAKLYDTLLSRRFSLWYSPKPEQAGAQQGRGCEEQILSVRLLVDIARKTGKTLYLAFVDYQKAYDKVDRRKLLIELNRNGCGTRFLTAIGRSMAASACKIGSEAFTCMSGVKQGSASSCPLFTFFIDKTIQDISSVGHDSWLGSNHCLLFMDDTVIFATSREALTKKLQKLKECTDFLGMIIHPTKSQFLSINTQDEETIIIDNVTLSHTTSYIYLGSIISNQSMANQIKDHITSKYMHVAKFLSFLRKNNSAPYQVKLKVFDSAVKSAILYSCETWLSPALRQVESSYMKMLKSLLSVRESTCNDIILIETGQHAASAIIKDRQVKFFNKLSQRRDYNSSYLFKIIELAKTVKSPMAAYLTKLLRSEIDYVGEHTAHLKNKIINSTSTRRTNYVKVNPTLMVHPVYSTPEVIEYNRIMTSRMRLASHHLKVETGRWCRIPQDERICQCHLEVQDEEHALLRCQKTESIRQQYPFLSNCISITEFFHHSSPKDIASVCAKTLKSFQ
jgi:hypothetical protein